MTDDRCAIYMKADPFMKKDLETVRSMLKLYTNVDIILDRKWQNGRYLLSFNERKDIIDRDLGNAGITEYRIIPNDTSRYKTAIDNGVKNIAVELNNYTQPSELCEKFNMAKKIIPELTMVIIPQFSDCLVKSYNFLYELILEDVTRTQYKKYVSDYAYMKTKFQLMHKIGLTGNLGCDLASALQTFKSRGYETIDVGKLISDAFMSEDVITPAFAECETLNVDTTMFSATRNGKLIAVEENVLNACLRDHVMLDVWMKYVKTYVVKHAYRTILQTTCKMIVISTTLIHEFDLAWMFDDIVTVMSTPDAMISYALSLPDMNAKRYKAFQSVYIPLYEKRRMSSYYIDSSEGAASTIANTLHLINRRLENDF